MKAKLKLKKGAKKSVKEKVKVDKKAPAVVSSVAALANVDLAAVGERWQSGTSIAILAREIGGVSWNLLHSELTKIGYKKG